MWRRHRASFLTKGGWRSNEKWKTKNLCPSESSFLFCFVFNFFFPFHILAEHGSSRQHKHILLWFLFQIVYLVGIPEYTTHFIKLYKRENIFQLEHPQMLKTYHGTFIQQLYAHNPCTIFKHQITGIWSKLAIKYNVFALYWVVMTV